MVEKFSIFFIFIFSASGVFAQLSPAFDPNIYLPRIGVPGEIDTIMGSKDGQGLGSFIFNTGVTQGQPNANMLIQGLPQNPPFFGEVETGNSFDLHKLNIRKQLDLDDKTIIKYGHFHDTKHNDLFAYTPNDIIRIYWADDSGYYLKQRATELVSSIVTDNGYYFEMDPYTARLTSDTVDDIVTDIRTAWFNFHRDSNFLFFYKGGKSLFNKGAAAVQDSTYNLGVERNCTQGDWRGTGREDLIAADVFGNAFYYHNDPLRTFSLAEFYRALQNDTLFAARDNPHFKGNNYTWSMKLAMKALTKTDGDKSLDLVLSPPTDDWRNNGIWFFRGGTDFGSHRITLDSAAYIIRHPKYYDPTAFNGITFPGGIFNCGDMTGTGNNVIWVSGGVEFTLLNFFYVTGQALDDKVDMYYLVEPRPGIKLDTLTANTDNMEDVLFGHLGLNNGAGALYLLYGSKKIPVRLNAVYEHTLPQSSLEIYPNIFSDRTHLSFQTEHSEPIIIIVRDVLGRVIYEEKRYSIGGNETISIHLPTLSSGRYILQVSGADIYTSAPITIIH